MLGRKRNPSKTNKKIPKSKKAEEKINQIKTKTRNDEDILSDSENENMKDNDDNNLANDDFFAKNSESVDEKRLRLAKTLINKIGKDEKEVDEYLNEEIKKEQQEHFTEYSSKLNPYETIFLKGHKNTITSLQLTNDSKSVYTTAKDCRVIKWDLETGKKLLLPQFTKKTLLCSALALNDKVGLFAGKDRYIYQIDLNSYKVINSFKAHNDAISGIVFDESKDQFYSISQDNTMKVWALTNHNTKALMVNTFWGHTGKINDMDLMTRNRILTCGADNQVNLWKTESQSFLQFKIDELSITDNIKAFNNDTFLTSTDDGCLSLWKTNKKKPIYKLKYAHGFRKQQNLLHPFFINKEVYDDIIHGKETDIESVNLEIPFPITSLSCLKNSDLIFSGSNNGTLNFYKYQPEDTNKIELIRSMQLREGSLNAIKVDKMNEFLVVGNGRDSRLGRWEVEENAKNGISIIKLFEN
jgi:ribosomal RNA-processing protein 9